MKNKGLYIAILLFFLIVSTTKYWVTQVGEFVTLIYLLLIVYFLVLTILLLVQVFLSVKENFKNGQRMFLIALLTIILCLSLRFPTGLLNLGTFDGAITFTAQREGSANCMTTLTLRKNNTFNERTTCFSVSEIKGSYTIKGDTIFFNDDSNGIKKKEFYKFAVIKINQELNENYLGDLIMYKEYTDTIGVNLWIIKNDLKKDTIY